MKAVRYHEYGSPDVLRIESVEKPSPADNEVLIRVRAASVNPMEYHLIHAPYIMRPFFGMRGPKDPRVGADLAGEVEAVGKNVTTFKPGDAVFGAARGALAEYACGGETRLALKPANVTFEEAASATVAGLTALQGLRDKGQIATGQKVLITGASGGVGTFAVQIAKHFGADVTGVCSTRNLELVRSIGASEAIDYTKTDFTQSNRRFDMVFDCVGNRRLSDIRRIMTPKGNYVGVGAIAGGSVLALLSHLLDILISSPFVSQRAGLFSAHVKAEDLRILGELISAKAVKPVIARVYSLSEAAEALRHVGTEHAGGKVVVTVTAE